MENLSGQHLGRYHIVEQLGEGGMASVYKAYDTRLERYVAIKVIRTEKGDDANFLKRFEREAKALARLSHANIVHVNDYGEQDGVPYVVMDYIPGGTLKQKLGQPMPYREAARLLFPVAQALQHAHRHAIIHRDVKPANILMTSEDVPMLSDFGIAKILESEQTSELTGTGVGIGTPEYMAPEQGSGLKIDERADIYALGVVFYELITGRKPFRADTPMAVVVKHMTEPLPRPSAFVAGLPQQVEQVIFKALAKKPDDRYQSMQQFADALNGLEQMPDGKAPSKPRSIPPAGIAVALLVALGILALSLICIFGFVFNYRTLMGNKNSEKPVQTVTFGQNTSAAEPSEAQKFSQSAAPRTTGASNVGGLVILSQQQGDLKSGDTLNLKEVDVPPGLKMIMISFSWDAGSLEPLVIKPDGTPLDVNGQSQEVFVVTSANMVNYNIVSPDAGTWQFALQNVRPDDQGSINYLFSVSYPQEK